MAAGKTEINRKAYKATELNFEAQQTGASSTAINPEVSGSPAMQNGNSTAINTEINASPQGIGPRTLLLNKYLVEKPLSSNTGEASLYICSYDGKKYVAKVYRRVSAIKDEVLDVLKQLDSPYVARVCDVGDWGGYPFVIIPYYKEGSLENRTFSYEELRNSIIPNLNEALRVLHTRNVIHKDLKPANIMFCDDRKTVALIDFGISSFLDDGQTITSTRTGMTPEYSAPEALRNLFLDESDYYSLGITIYELYCGHTPYANTDREVLEKYIVAQKLPFPDDFPQKLKELVLGLTYGDITNRNDKKNPHRRWTYDEVKKWCAGESQPLPGGTAEIPADKDDSMPQITFMYNKYTSISKYVEALGGDWKNGKRRLYRSELTEHFKKFNRDLANICMNSEDMVRDVQDKKTAQIMEDIGFFRCIYSLYPQMKSFHWKDEHFSSMEDFGFSILDDLRNNRDERMEDYAEMMKFHIFSTREDCVTNSKGKRIESLKALEDSFNIDNEDDDLEAKLTQLFRLGYLYSKSQELVTSKGSFTSVDGLAEYVKAALGGSSRNLDNLSKELIMDDSDCTLQPEFHAWLEAQGCSQVLKDL